ncbi:MAG TPA: hypothetical protein GXX34_11925 [Clostridia bacterium]|nr:hypothetical protein [Clostridia bacterium]
MRADSDIDFLLEFSQPESGLVFVELKRRLEHKLKRKVDLITYNSLQYSKYKDDILKEAKVIDEKTTAGTGLPV